MTSITDTLSRGGRIVLTHGEFGDSYSVEPGGAELSASEARRLIATMSLEPGRDELIDGARPQTWGLRASAERIVEVLSAARFPIVSEKPLQAAMADALTSGGIIFRREHRLSEKDVIDFLAGATGIEVKIGGSKRAIYKQCERYCAHAEIEALVLATNIAMGFPSSINGKPCFLVNLGRAWL